MASVGGLTLLSRIAGFFRDIVLAAVLGAGPVADAFFVALRLPNHFRAIFAEGAFNAAFVPSYARVREQGGAAAAGFFADRVFTLLFASQIVLLALALGFTPAVIDVLAPGFAPGEGRYALAVELTRITFPYLLMMTLVTLIGGMLNAIDRFAAAAAAPVLLNLVLMAALGVATFFPTAGHAAAWGVLIAGVLEFLLVAGDAKRAGIMVKFRWPRWDADVKRFFGALAPATLGSAGVQVALFADTILASFLSVGALSALYYADRLNQLPIGVIGIAAGTVLLPEMARRIATGDEKGAQAAQNRAIEITLALALPFVVGFLVVPDLIMRALFARGAFTAADAANAGATLRAYSLGLVPFVLIRSLTATFFARGDTATPVKASLSAVALNVFLKIALVTGTALAQVGLALATAAGAWMNVALVAWFAVRRGLLVPDGRLARSLATLAAAAAALAVAIGLGQAFLKTAGLRDEVLLAALAALGAAIYMPFALAIFGRNWRATLGLRRRSV
ncbi:MAG TPA: murein biosynthesis integral membrane protein MurJ [Xanthobacteraceae bacterium]|nr:murein biosynthesis integral membrane protein MurJ [Xanthobacteraceae bacterium]